MVGVCVLRGEMCHHLECLFVKLSAEREKETISATKSQSMRITKIVTWKVRSDITSVSRQLSVLQCWPWVEGCGIKSPAWNYLLILHSSQPTGLFVCTRLKCTRIWRGDSHPGLGLSEWWTDRWCAVFLVRKTRNPLPSQKNKSKDNFGTGRMLVRVPSFVLTDVQKLSCMHTSKCQEQT